MDRKCKTCGYSEAAPDVKDTIFCKRYAPRPGTFKGWPLLWADDWCGEWERSHSDNDEKL